MKNRILVAFMLALALTLATFAAPVVQNLEGADEYAEALDTGVQTAENRTNLVPILREGDPVPEKQTASLASDVDAKDKIVAKNISTTGLFVSEKTVYAEVTFDLRTNGLHDAKTKLALSIVDEANRLVAKQKSCEIAFCKETYDLSLKYELETVASQSFSYEHQYFFKFDYTGAFAFENECYFSSMAPSAQTTLIKMEIVNSSQNIVDFYMANANDNDQYVFNIQNVDYTPEKIANGVYRVQMTELDYSDSYDGELDIYVTVRTFMGHVCSGNFVFCYVGSNEHTGSKGVYGDERIHVESDYTYVMMELKENYEGYTQADASKVNVSVYDGITGEIVGKSKTSDVDINGGYCEVVVKITGTLVADRKYIVAVDDGLTIRIWYLNSVDGRFVTDASIKHPGGLDGEDFWNRNLFEADSYSIRMHDVYCMPDMSKLDVVIADYEGNVYAEFDKSSIVTKNASADKMYYGIVDFDMDVVGTLAQNSYYRIIIMYDGTELSSYELYYFPEETEDSSGLYVQVASAFNDGTDTYVMLEVYSAGEFVPENAKFEMVSTYASAAATSSYTGQIHKNFGYNGYCYMMVLKFPTAESISWNYRIEVTYAAEEPVKSYGFGSEYAEMPYIYDYVRKDGDGKAVLCGEGLSDNSSYVLMLFDEASGKAIECPVTKTRGKDELVADIRGIEKYRLSDIVYLSIDGKYMIRISPYDIIPEFYFSGSDFYAVCRNQDHRIAIVGLPSGDYAQYRLADSEAGLKKAPYASIKDFVTYVLPEGDGKKIIYAQFKDSKGKESDVMTTFVVIDITGPDFKNVRTATEYSIDKWGYFSVNVDFETDTAGYIYCQILDGEGNIIGTEIDYIHSASYTFKSFSFDAGINESAFTKAKKLVIYMTDDYNNKSQKWEFDISVEMPYSVLETDDMYIVVDNETGHIVHGTDIYIEDGTSPVTLPAYVNGVAVTGIEDFAFNSCFIGAMYIPATYTYFESVDAFYGTGFTTFYVVEGSPAHEFMKQNAMNWDIAGLSKGDTDGDFVTTQEDVIVIADYILNPTALTEAQVAAADVYGDDGVVDIKDIIKLAQMASEQ